MSPRQRPRVLGRQQIVDPFGRVIAEGKIGDEDIVTAELDLAEVREARTVLHTVRDEDLRFIRRRLDDVLKQLLDSGGSELVIEEETTFYSEGLKLDASFYLPDPGTEVKDRPIVLTCSGFMGLNRIHPARFARAFTARGYTCFGFDYRGFADSEGGPRACSSRNRYRHRQRGSLRHDHPNAYQGRVLFMGWGMGGGLVLEAARLIPRVVGLVCMNGFYNGKRVQKMVRGFSAYVEFLERTDAARAITVKTGEVVEVDPFSISLSTPSLRITSILSCARSKPSAAS